ncbi:MAG: 50S ribosomal protein L9 [Candidatus Liptonbacteria bacterium]|nr:50S ribosomal protein L9 [Candidatus Liptonbacteria bacterium]
MKIILLQDSRGIGRKNDVKDVSDGYARNFLFPSKLAEPATDAALKKLEKMKAMLNEDEAKFKRHVEELKGAMGARTLEFFLKTGGDGSVFGSVNKESILAALRDTGLITKERVDIELERPIKELGEHKIKIRFKNGIEGEIKIVIKKLLD